MFALLCFSQYGHRVCSVWTHVELRGIFEEPTSTWAWGIELKSLALNSKCSYQWTISPAPKGVLGVNKIARRWPSFHISVLWWHMAFNCLPLPEIKVWEAGRKHRAGNIGAENTFQNGIPGLQCQLYYAEWCLPWILYKCHLKQEGGLCAGFVWCPWCACWILGSPVCSASPGRWASYRQTCIASAWCLGKKVLRWLMKRRHLRLFVLVQQVKS